MPPDAELGNQISELLMMMQDPYIKNKFSYYKKMAHMEKGPSFLQRMEHDKQIRATIHSVNMGSPE